MCLLRKFKSFFLLCIVCLSARITACLITIVNLINEVWTRAFVFLTTLIKRTGVNSIILRVKHGRVAGIHNLHMSSNSYIRINLEMQYHTISVLLQSNIENEGFTRQTIYTVNCWAPIQRGLRPDRPTQPETWRCSETLQGGKKIQQPGISLQSTTEACCHRRCQKHVLWLCLCKSWPGRRSSQRTVQRICWNCIWFGLGLYVWIRVKGIKRKPFPQMALLRATQIIKKENL